MNILVGDDVDKCLNGSLLHYNRPFDRGYLINWQCEIGFFLSQFQDEKHSVFLRLINLIKFFDSIDLHIKLCTLIITPFFCT
mmetsp:Transcript_22151/g.21382  ORF Transcript_22151/g.21382 Transcript_22151/m.21382 type:complete len:82 (-) Transcript_22151:175-420(-)